MGKESGLWGVVFSPSLGQLAVRRGLGVSETPEGAASAQPL